MKIYQVWKYRNLEISKHGNSEDGDTEFQNHLLYRMKYKYY